MQHICNDRVHCEKDPGYAAFGCFAAGDIHNVHESDDGTRLLGYVLYTYDGITRKDLVMYPFNWQEEGYEDEGWYEYQIRDGKIFTFLDWADEQDREWKEKKEQQAKLEALKASLLHAWQHRQQRQHN